MKDFDKKNRGILLCNLGTPAAPTTAAIRRYLRQFLLDKRVIEIPHILWWPILNGLILPVRSRRTSRLYQKIWTESGSPLLLIMERLRQRLQSKLQNSLNTSVPTAIGMRYGAPSIAQGLKLLSEQGCNHLIVLPLYPQYSATTTGSTFDAVSHELQNWRVVPGLSFIDQYALETPYIDAIAQSISQHWQKQTKADKLLFSFHGLPQRYIDQGDPYQIQCEATAQAIAQKLGLNADQWQTCYQSRLGPSKWLQPYTDQVLQQLPQQGCKSVDVVCPGFSIDCLETLEEIAITNKKIFIDSGGQDYQYIPALNDSDLHLQVISAIVDKCLVID
jgi:protoporphyrin/coproporphyrin ferrochelatase